MPLRVVVRRRMKEARESRLAFVATAAVCVVAVSGAIVYSQRRHSQLQQLRTVEDKPQKKFKRVLADNSDSPFLHFPSPLTGLQDGHPYGEVIVALAESPQLPFAQYYGDSKAPPGMEGPCVWVQTRGQLEALVELLNGEYEIGVDIEHHSVRSFRGFTALVQISTHMTDFLVDAIALHDDMHLLHPIFANPAICKVVLTNALLSQWEGVSVEVDQEHPLKVFHGTDSDSLWLQRDFHIYIVNLFDTARACDVLGKPQRSLAYLLQTYCGVLTNKVYQRADWRLRPLPAEMEQYARIDAHYLLYLAHCLRTELLQSCARQEDRNDQKDSELLLEAVRRSNLLCLHLYEKEGAGVSSLTVATSLLARMCSNSGSPTLAEDGDQLRKLVKKLCEWRDTVARTEDESLRFVLSDAALLALATNRPLTHDSIFSTIAAADAVSQASEASAAAGVPPLPSPSPVVQHHIAALCDFFLEFAGESKDAVWPWKARTETHDGGGFFNGHVFSFLHRTSLLSFLGFGRNSNPEMVIEGKEGGPTGVRRREGWERKSIPKRWRLGNVEQARLHFVKKFSCKAPVYHNCRIYAGDGRLLCFCDRKKLEWYVKRGLGEDMGEDPPAIRLLFEPKGRPEDENNEFYIQSKTNRCVGCGESSHYLRYRIIPSCYRQHFPEHLKSHRSHDIVLLCVDCHEIAHRAAEKHKREIALEYGVPLFAYRVVDAGSEAAVANEVAFVAEGETGGVSPLQLRSAAMALSRHGSTMPVDRRKQLEEVVKNYYGGRDIGPEDLRTALVVGLGPREHRRLLKKSNLRQNSNNLSRDKRLSSADAEAENTEIFLRTPVGGDSQMVLGSNTDNEKHMVDETSVSLCGEEERGEPHDEQHWNVTRSDGDNSKDENASLAVEVAGLPSRHNRKSMQRESLLGHGPHGRHVVDMLIAQAGDDGIRQFCQLWRAVFVDALQPAFLPPGWDVSHSGRREFGEFSVYNPENQNGHD